MVPGERQEEYGSEAHGHTCASDPFHRLWFFVLILSLLLVSAFFFHSPLPLYMAVFTQRFHRDELLPSISSYPLVECLVLGFLPSLTRLKVHEQLSSASSSNKSAIEVRRPVFWCSVASEPQMKSTNFIFTGSFPLWELSLCDAMATKVMTCLHRLRRRTWGVTK